MQCAKRRAYSSRCRALVREIGKSLPSIIATNGKLRINIAWSKLNILIAVRAQIKCNARSTLTGALIFRSEDGTRRCFNVPRINPRRFADNEIRSITYADKLHLANAFSGTCTLESTTRPSNLLFHRAMQTLGQPLSAGRKEKTLPCHVRRTILTWSRYYSLRFP